LALGARRSALGARRSALFWDTECVNSDDSDAGRVDPRSEIKMTPDLKVGPTDVIATTGASTSPVAEASPV